MMDLSKRCGSVLAVVFAAFLFFVPATVHAFQDSTPPNIILCMADDQGWGDVGFRGHPQLKTPHLDDMAANGLRFDRFYAAAPVCSPTRGSCLTGRHPSRYGILGANVGHLPPDEVNLAEILRERGYATGHFGKWHLGTLTTTVRDSNRGGKPAQAEHFSPPWVNGFDECFSTEAKVPTHDPMVNPETGAPYGTRYWTGPDQPATENLNGDDSRIIMDRALEFAQRAVDDGRPFFIVIWFHAPHLPAVASAEDRAPYAELPENLQHYYGCISALDEQMGRLRAVLRELDVAENTMLWYCSDNGPESNQSNGAPGSTAGLRGRKRSLYEGGVRVPAILEWPARILEGRVTSVPATTSDYLPTILGVVGLDLPSNRELDGESLLPIIDDVRFRREGDIAFASRTQRALIGERFKLISTDRGATYELYDLVDDPGETRDLAATRPELATAMQTELEAWIQQCAADAETD